MLVSDAKQRQGRLAALWKRFKQHDDDCAREQLIVEYADLVKYTAGRVAIGMPGSVDLDDLISYGIFGLMDAIDKFELQRGIKFESYALARIRGSIIDGLRAVDWVPRSVRSKARQLERNVAALEFSLGRSATEAEIMRAIQLTSKEYHQLLDEIKSAAVTSLDEVWTDGDDDEKLRLGDMVEDRLLPEPSTGVEGEAVKQTLTEAIEALPERERIVVTLYYYEGLTLKEIGQVLEVTESRVSQIHTQAVTRLRGRLERIRDAVV